MRMRRLHTPGDISHVCYSLTCKSELNVSLHRILQLVIVGCLINCFNMFNYGTWNVCGLKQDHKRVILGNDCVSYKVDVLGLQETKCTTPEDLRISNGFRLIIMDQKHGWHGGLGFVLSPRMLPFVKSYSYVRYIKWVLI